MNLRHKLQSINWCEKTSSLEESGYFVLNNLLDSDTCNELATSYDNEPERFRSTISMSRYNFGAGEYKYFSYPLPLWVERLRGALFPPLASIANNWVGRLGLAQKWPDKLEDMLERCRQAEQTRPTPLLLKYQNGDYNCLHQDLYGEVYFPLQAIALLSRPSIDFCGGELILVEQRPRMQSRPVVVPLNQGDVVIIPVRERPRTNQRGRSYRVQIKHGVGEVSWGTRYTLGVIFHDGK